MNSEGYRTHRAVTGPMSFKKSRRFVGKPCSRHFGAPGCHPSTLIDLVHTAFASKCSVKTICLISEGYRTHRAVTGPMSFKKSIGFVGKSCSRDFGAPGCHPSTLIDLVHTALASKCSVKTICRISEGYRNHRGVTGTMKFKKSRRFVGNSCSRVSGAPGCLHVTLFDIANTALASKCYVETICMNSEGYRSHRAVIAPMSFKKSRRFVGKPCSRLFGAHGCHPSTLIDLLHTAFASKCSVRTICLISEGYRTHRAVTGPMSFKKSIGFVGKSCSRDFGAPGCHPSTLIDLVHTALASKCSVKTICRISEGYRNHRGVTGTMKFKKSRRFVGNSCSRVSGAPGCLHVTLFDIANTALASKCYVETICMNSEGYRTHRAVTGPMSFKKSRGFVGKSCSRVFGAPGYIKALYLTLQTLFWLVKVL